MIGELNEDSNVRLDSLGQFWVEIKMRIKQASEVRSTKMRSFNSISSRINLSYFGANWICLNNGEDAGGEHKKNWQNANGDLSLWK